MKNKKLAIIFILIFSVLLEVFVFNINHFRTLFGNFIEYNYKVPVATFNDKNATYEIPNLNCKVATFSITLDDKAILKKINEDNKDKPIENFELEYRLYYSDETSAEYRGLPSKHYISGNKGSHYITTFLSGDVSKLKVAIDRRNVEDIDYIIVGINQKIPFKFNIARFIIVSIILIFVYLINTAEFFAQSYSRYNIAQQLCLFGVLVVFFLLMFWVNKYSTPDTEDTLYNVEFVNSILHGKFDLDVEISDKFKELDNPYDDLARSNSLIRDVDYKWDTAYYGGKVYEYFGILPLLLFFLPYRLVTKKYLAISPVVFILSVCIGILLKEILEKIIDRYFPDTPFKMVVRMLLLLCFGSLLLYANALGRVYELAIISGLFFALAGIFLILQSMSVREQKFIYLFFGCLCLALSVACRPTDALVSFLIVPYLIGLLINSLKKVNNFYDSSKYGDTLYTNSKLSLLKLIASVGVPYFMVRTFANVVQLC